MDDMSSFAPESKGSGQTGEYAQYDGEGAVFFGGKYVSDYLT